ncbi:hypothetical protein PPROV_000125100 [Pycnococcus provasolii]|uniref:OBG-type G domain-containing protein n=1 Tax=Pycnococcus provasolii TaxID=41880 RepID=A0A830H630_9CHLO|nr:hypothetical protein PPROV_000125100 [Pycnococcus provasolii]
MPTYNFKRITVVPTASSLIDTVLSSTQRKTPTEVHSKYHVTRIRQFYMRKVKFNQQLWSEKLSAILEEFPRLDDLHPFWGDLLNVLYDRDHYKLALGQIHLAWQLINKIAKDYIRLLKYGDSLYRCKTLKRAALGRMCTIVKKQNSSLQYLEQVRQHLGRLPSIDPSTRTLILCGYPNVGKSSFLNKVSRADVEVQPYAFTTKQLFVGHVDHAYLRWQVIDTPGILDRPLDERNTVEMQAVTALAHLRAAVVYMMDASETCGYTIAQQCALFHQIKPLFLNKPLVVGINKLDLLKVAGPEPMLAVSAENLRLLVDVARSADAAANGVVAPPQPVGATMDARALVAELRACASVSFLSTVTEVGVHEVKRAACERLLAQRVEAKARSKRFDGVAHRLHVAQPDGVGGELSANHQPTNPTRPPCIPKSVLALHADEDAMLVEMAGARRREAEAAGTAEPAVPALDGGDGERARKDLLAAIAARRPKRETEKDLQELHGGAGVYSADMRKNYMLEDEEWKYDIVPEIMDGKNVFDYVDPEIEERLLELEAEEEELEAEHQAAMAEAEQTAAPDMLTEEEAEELKALRKKKHDVVEEHRDRKARASNNSIVPRSADTERRSTTRRMRDSLEAMGYDAEGAVRRARDDRRGREESRMGRSVERKRKRDASSAAAMEMEEEKEKKRVHSSKSRSMSRGRAASMTPDPKSKRALGLKDDAARMKSTKLGDKSVRKRSKDAKRGEGDRHVPDLKPKHLYSGKTGRGARDWR